MTIERLYLQEGESVKKRLDDYWKDLPFGESVLVALLENSLKKPYVFHLQATEYDNSVYVWVSNDWSGSDGWAEELGEERFYFSANGLDKATQWLEDRWIDLVCEEDSAKAD